MLRLFECLEALYLLFFNAAALSPTFEILAKSSLLPQVRAIGALCRAPTDPTQLDFIFILCKQFERTRNVVGGRHAFLVGLLDTVTDSYALDIAVPVSCKTPEIQYFFIEFFTAALLAGYRDAAWRRSVARSAARRNLLKLRMY